MSDLGRHGRNISWLFLADLVGKIIGFFYFKYLFDKLTKTENEWYTFIIIAMPLLSALNSLGFQDVVNREVTKRRDRIHGLISSGITIQFAAALAVIPSVWLATRALNYPAELQRILVLTAAMGMLWALIHMHQAVMAAYELFKYQSWINMAIRVVMVTGSFALLFMGYRVRALAIYMIFSQVVQLAICRAIVSTHCGGYHYRPNRKDAAYLLKQGLQMVFGRLSAAGYYRCDLPLLRSLGEKGASENFAIGPRFFTLLTSIPDTLEIVFYPIMSRKSIGKEEERLQAVEKFFKIVFIFAFPLGVGMTVLGRDIVRDICGTQYIADTPTAIVFVWLIALAMCDRAAVVYLRAQARQYLLLYCYGFVLTVKLALAYPIIQRYGIPGLLIFNMAGSMGITTVMLGLTRVQLPSFSLGRLGGLAARPIFASMVMAGCLCFCQGNPVWWTVPLGAIIYGVVLLATGILDDFDKRMLKSFLGRG